jgi:hypothetical protein
MNPSIRKMIESDISELVELWHITKKLAYPYLPLEQNRTLEDDSTFFRQRLMPRCDIWVAESAKRLIGFLQS